MKDQKDRILEVMLSGNIVDDTILGILTGFAHEMKRRGNLWIYMEHTAKEATTEIKTLIKKCQKENIEI